MNYYANTNRLKSVADGMGGTGDNRNMGDVADFVYDSEGNLTEDKSKQMKIAYDWRGMPVEFKRQDKCYDIHEQVVCDSIKLEIAYDGAGSRVSKTLLRKLDGTTGWNLEKKTHYTGIGSEIRVDGQNGTKVVVNMPQGLGRYGIDNEQADEFYLKNHLGSTMLVAKVSSSNAPAEISAAYDYRAFGEQVTLSEPTEKVTENFTGKERDDETELNYFGARYLDPMLGMWFSVDPKRQFASPYLYAGNGVNPVNGVDDDGNILIMDKNTAQNYMSWLNSSTPEINAERWKRFNTLNNSPRVYQSVYSEGSDFDFTTSRAYAVNGTYDNKANIGYVNGSKENFFHEMLGHAYHDEIFMQQEERDLGKGVSKNEYIEMEIDAREIERGRVLTPEEKSDVKNVYGKEWDNAE